MTIDLELEVRRLTTRINDSVEAEEWADARDYCSSLVQLLDGSDNLNRYEVVVGVAEQGREWFHETVVVSAPTRTIAAMRGEADVRRTREVHEDAFVRATVIGHAQPADPARAHAGASVDVGAGPAAVPERPVVDRRRPRHGWGAHGGAGRHGPACRPRGGLGPRPAPARSVMQRDLRPVRIRTGVAVVEGQWYVVVEFDGMRRFSADGWANEVEALAAAEEIKDALHRRMAEIGATLVNVNEN